ncbi:MAG: hypothetical protein ACOCQW_01740 [Halanaerobiaceae bacterium]
MKIAEDFTRGLNQLEIGRIGYVIILLLITICPGFLIIYLWDSALIMENSFINMILLSLSITTPLYLFNTFLSFLLLYFLIMKAPDHIEDFVIKFRNEKKNNYMGHLLIVSIINSLETGFLILFIGIILAHLLHYNINGLILTLIVLEVIFYCSEIFYGIVKGFFESVGSFFEKRKEAKAIRKEEKMIKIENDETKNEENI